MRILIRLRFCVTSTNTAAGAWFRSRAISITGSSIIPVLIALLFLVIGAAYPASAQTQARRAKKPSAKASSRTPTKRATTSSKKGIPSTPPATAGEKQLAQLARGLRDHPNATSYAVLSAYATKNAKNELGADAALALGYYDLMRDKPDLAIGWLRKAAGDKDLREYVQYWQAQASLALGQKDEGLEQLQNFRREFPNSVMAEQVVTSLAQTALSLDKLDDAQAALDGYANTTSKPGLLFLRAQTREKLAQVREIKK